MHFTPRGLGIFLIAAVTAGVSGGANAAVVYVNTDRFGLPADGASWATAYGTIQAALNGSAAGDHLWVAEGPYLETLILPSNRQLYGGFLGTETLLSQRNAALNTTAIDGNGAAVSVVDFNGVTSVLTDGFTITGGAAANGAGARFNGANNTNTLSNCIITENAGNYGGGIYMEGSSPAISDCVITENSATYVGAGIHANNSSPTVVDCTISNNLAGANGGAGLSFISSSAGSVTNCFIYSNVNDGSVSSGGGGGIGVSGSSTAFSNCIITGNTGDTGGGVNVSGASPTFTNCVISGNTADFSGGAHVRASASSFTNCTFSGNVATSNYGANVRILEANFTTLMNCVVADGAAYNTGGGLLVSETDATATNAVITNTIFYGNIGGGIYELTTYADPTVTNCIFIGNSTADYRDFDGGNLFGAASINALVEATDNLSSDPAFEQAVFDTWNGSGSYDAETNTTLAYSNNAFQDYGANELAGRLVNPDTTQRRHFLILANDDSYLTLLGDASLLIQSFDAFRVVDYHITAGSVARDSGTNTGAPSTDFDGELRPFGATVDIGLDEFLDFDGDDVSDRNDSDDDNDGLSDTDEVDVYGTDPLDADSDDDGISDGFEVAAGTDPNDDTDAPETVYVKEGAIGAGVSWANAFGSLQDALDESAASGAAVWVAAGTYNEPVAITGQARIYGGFLGNETALGQRDFAANVTTIDATGQFSRAVFMSSDPHPLMNATIDGFTITGGSDTTGGGIRIEDADNSVTIANCVFSGNEAYGIGATLGGGAAYLLDSAPVFNNCRFVNNRATGGSGGAVLLSNSTASFAGCTIVGNQAQINGGGIYGPSPSAVSMSNCTISSNTASTGAGGGIGSAVAILESCIVSGNRSVTGGGIHLLSGANSTLMNLVISGNTTTSWGGGIYTTNDSSSIITNCTIVGNSAPASKGGGIWVKNGTPAISNTIFADNVSVAVYEGGVTSNATTHFSLFYGNPDGDYFDRGTALLTGAAQINALADASDNIDTNPVFESGPAGTWTQSGSYDSALHQTVLTDGVATFEPGAYAGRLIRANSASRAELYILANTATTITVAGDASSVVASSPYAITDYHLASASTAKDAGGIAGAPSTDIDGESRPFNSAADMGADEWVDADGDDLSDWIDPDDDNDGLDDDDEALYGSDPFDSDTDNDGLEDGDEVNTHGTDPLETDSDGDTVEDGDEVNVHGSDPARYEVWVDFAWNGALSGTPAEPLNDLAAAIAAVPAQGGIRINGASSDKISPFTGTISKKLGITSYGGKITIGVD